jgi:transcriptional regulator GlxA family with amidase domain
VRIAILTFDGFNEIDSFVVLNLLGRVDQPDWKAEICAPTETVTSLNGVTIHAQRPLEHARDADVVLFGSGRHTARIAADRAVMDRIRIDPARQLVGSQCSGALMLASLGLLVDHPACTDRATRPHLEAAGVRVLDRPFVAHGNVATAGGCLSAHYLGAWVITRCVDRAAAERALSYIVPVTEEATYIARALAAIAEA